MHMVYHVASETMPVKLLAQVRVLQREVFPGRFVDMKNYQYLVLVQKNGCIVGLAFVREHNPHTARTLECLCVHPSHQRKGIATSILDYTVKELSDLPMVLHVNSGYRHTELVEFYTKRGFELVYTDDEESMLCTPRSDGSLVLRDEYARLNTRTCAFKTV